jgi:nucleoside-diphosphate-sugar epimerase
MRRKQKRLPLLLPYGDAYPKKLLQFVHLDDMARLMAWLLHRAPAEANEIQVLNVAGSGAPISIAQSAEIAGARIVHLPSSWLCEKVMELLWRWEISAVPTDALPYISGSCTLSTGLLRELLGNDFGDVIRYSTEAALRASFAEADKSGAIPAGSISE